MKLCASQVEAIFLNIHAFLLLNYCKVTKTEQSNVVNMHNVE